MALGGQNKKTTCVLYGFLVVGVLGFDFLADRFRIRLRICGNRLHDLEFDVAAEFDVRPTPGHVGGNRDRAQLSGVSDDLRLLLMLAGVEDIVLQTFFFQKLAEHLGFLDRRGADQNGLALGMRLFDFFDDGVVFFLCRAVDPVVLVNPRDFAVGRHLDDAKPVDLGEFVGFGHGSAGHARQLFVKTEIVLECHAGQGHVLRANLAAFLGFDGLMQTFGQASACHHATREFVDQHDFAVAHDVILVALIELMGAQTLVHMVDQRRAFGIVKRLPLGQLAQFMQRLFEEFIALVREGHVPRLFVERVMLFRQRRDHLVDGNVKLTAVLRRAGDDQRCPCFVDQDGVDLIHDGEEVVALVHLVQLGLHVVAEVIEAKLVVGGIGDVAGIGGLLFGIGLARIDHTGGQAKRAVDLAHPLAVALRKVVVHRHDVHAAPGQRVQIGREGSDKRLAFARFHFRDVALMQEYPAHELHVECPQTQRALGGLPAVCKGFGQKRIKRLTVRVARLELGRFLDQLRIVKLFEFRFQCVDFFNQRAGRLDFAVVRRSEHLARDFT